MCPFSILAFLQPTTVDKEPNFTILQKNSITITYPQKKPPDWVASLGDYDEKSFRISLNKVRRSLFNDYIILDHP